MQDSERTGRPGLSSVISLVMFGTGALCFKMLS